MRYARIEPSGKLFKPKDICDTMSLVVNGMVEMHIEYDREKTVLERFGRGTIIN